MQQPIIMDFQSWYAVPDGMGCIDWDCDFYAKVFLPDGSIIERANNCQRDQEQLAAEFPDAFRPGLSLGMHRGKWEGNDALLWLRDNAPDHFARMMAQAEPRFPLTQNQ